MDVKDLFSKIEDYEGKEVTLEGWVRNNRNQSNFGFIDFNDGTYLALYNQEQTDYGGFDIYTLTSDGLSAYNKNPFLRPTVQNIKIASHGRIIVHDSVAKSVAVLIRRENIVYFCVSNRQWRIAQAKIKPGK